MEIRFITEIDQEYGYDREIRRIIIDGIKDSESELVSDSFYIFSKETFNKLKQASFKKLNGFFSNVTYSFDVNWSEYPIHLIITFSDSEEEGYDRYIRVSLEINYLEWDKPYALYEFVEKHKEIITAIKDVKYIKIDDIRYETIGNFFELGVIIEDTSKPIYKYVDFAIEKLKEAHLLSLQLLHNKYFSEGISVLYQFPHEIKAACNQYLIYLAQFLQDLGISAETSLKEQANQVLFTIVPQDKKQALDVIYKALTIYIEASNEEISKNIIEGDLAIMQWKANIFHLQSQLELSKAMLQAKDATIEALKLSNYQLQSFIPKSQKEEVENKDEKILGGLATVNNVKLKGVTINLPEILRRLKRRFG